MASFSGLGIGLSFIFGCFLLGLVAELYYLLWWKKRISNAEIEDRYTSYAMELSNLFCWKKHNSLRNNNKQEVVGSVRNPDVNGQGQDLELGVGKGSLLKGSVEEGVESELMRIHNLCGPPRFLFTIMEETKEDLESDDGKSRGDRSRKGSRTRSLSDLILSVDTPFLSPLSSPPLKAQPLDTYNFHGFNPLFESEIELCRLRSSPPPKFKFLRDAEEKLLRRLLQEAQNRGLKNGAFVKDSVVKAPLNSTTITEEKEDTISKNKERKLHHQVPLCNSTVSKVLPLPSSPSTIRPLDNNSIV